MEKKKMIELRNLLYKMTLIGFVFLFSGIVLLMLFPGWLFFLWGIFLGASPEEILPIAWLSFAVFKTVIVCLFFIPALALHWQCKGK